MERPEIPAEIKRRVLVEAGHRCAIPTCRFPTTEIAHIKPYAEAREHKYENLIALCPNCHTRYDKGEMDRKAMHIYKSKLLFISDRYSLFELNVLDYLNKNGKVTITHPLFVKNLLDNLLIKNAHQISGFTYNDGVNEVNEFVAVLTDEGKSFIQQWADDSNNTLTY